MIDLEVYDLDREPPDDLMHAFPTERAPQAGEPLLIFDVDDQGRPINRAWRVHQIASIYDRTRYQVTIIAYCRRVDLPTDPPPPRKRALPRRKQVSEQGTVEDQGRQAGQA